MRAIEGTALTFVAMLASLGCANGLSQRQLVDTQAAIDSTEQLDDGRDPKAALHLSYARDQLARAKQLDDDGDEDAAVFMLDRAQADAELALVLARTASDRAAAKEAWQEVEKLRSQQEGGSP